MLILRHFIIVPKVTYDKNQNRRSMSIDGDDNAYEINNLNQYTSFDTQRFEYDKNGYLTEMRDIDTEYTEKYKFDPEGKFTG